MGLASLGIALDHAQLREILATPTGIGTLLTLTEGSEFPREFERLHVLMRVVA
jgi:hypothetical protein